MFLTRHSGQRRDPRPVTSVIDRRSPANGRTMHGSRPACRRRSAAVEDTPAPVGRPGPHRARRARRLRPARVRRGARPRPGGVHLRRGARRARHPPYVGIFNSVGPLADAVPGLAIWLGHFVGADPILSARLFFTVLSALCCSLLCVLARDTLRSRPQASSRPPCSSPSRTSAPGLRRPAREDHDGPVHARLPHPARAPALGAGGCLCGARDPDLAARPGRRARGAVAAALLDQQDRRRRILLRFTLGGLVRAWPLSATSSAPAR